MRYPGGKGKCYQRLINLMPPHRTYIESHLGGGAVIRHKSPAQVNIGVEADLQVIDWWQRNQPDICSLIHADASAFLEDYPFIGKELVYSDPPYLAEVRRRPKVYRLDYTVDDHVRLLEVLRALPCMVMLSGYDSAMYREKLSDWRCVSFPSKTHVGIRQESVWLNFDPPADLHDPSNLGSTFRERQTIKRRHHRMVEKFGRMDPVERSWILRLLYERYNESTLALSL